MKEKLTRATSAMLGGILIFYTLNFLMIFTRNGDPFTWIIYSLCVGIGVIGLVERDKGMKWFSASSIVITAIITYAANSAFS